MKKGKIEWMGTYEEITKQEFYKEYSELITKNEQLHHNQNEEIKDLEDKEIFKKNVAELAKQVEGGNIKSINTNESSEEMNDLRTALEHKNYQVEILKKEFTKYEEKAEEQIENLKTENAKLKYRIHILLNTIDELEKKGKK